MFDVGLTRRNGVLPIVRLDECDFLVNIARPGSFAEFAFGPEVFGEFDQWGRAGCEDYSYYIESIFYLQQAKDPTIHARRPSDLTLLSRRYAGDRIRKLRGVLCLHLDKAKNITIERDQVDLTRHRGTPTVPSDGNFEVREDKAVPLRLEILRG